MRTIWLILALTTVIYAIQPEPNLCGMTWQVISEAWQSAAAKMSEHSDFIHLIQATKLVIC